MKILLSLLSIAVLVFSTNSSLAGTCSQLQSDAPELKRFTKDVQDAAKQFTERLKKTREFSPKGDDLFVESFVECHLQAELNNQDNNIFRQIGASVPPGVVSAASKDELQKYLLAQFKFFHLKALHRISTRDLEVKLGGSVPSAEDEYPPGVYALLTKNPVIAAAVTHDTGGVRFSSNVQNVQELRSVLRTLEDAMLVMRDHFRIHPPEKTELYKKNMERIGNDKNNSKFWEVSFHKLTDQQTKESTSCLGFAATSMAIIKVPPFYQLFVFQSGKQFKIGSLVCTEPPCVD